MTPLDIIGSLAGILTTISFIPQVLKTWKSGSAEDISLFMFVLFSTGVLLWLIYGAGIGSLPIIIANGITLVLSLAILSMKLRFMWMKQLRDRMASQRGL